MNRQRQTYRPDPSKVRGIHGGKPGDNDKRTGPYNKPAPRYNPFEALMRLKGKYEDGGLIALLDAAHTAFVAVRGEKDPAKKAEGEAKLGTANGAIRAWLEKNAPELFDAKASLWAQRELLGLLQEVTTPPADDPAKPDPCPPALIVSLAAAAGRMKGLASMAAGRGSLLSEQANGRYRAVLALRKGAETINAALRSGKLVTDVEMVRFDADPRRTNFVGTAQLVGTTLEVLTRAAHNIKDRALEGYLAFATEEFWQPFTWLLGPTPVQREEEAKRKAWAAIKPLPKKETPAARPEEEPKAVEEVVAEDPDGPKTDLCDVDFTNLTNLMGEEVTD